MSAIAILPALGREGMSIAFAPRMADFNDEMKKPEPTFWDKVGDEYDLSRTHGRYGVKSPEHGQAFDANRNRGESESVPAFFLGGMAGVVAGGAQRLFDYLAD